MSHIEISRRTKIGGGLYIGHAYCITVNENARIGENCNIHKGVTIGARESWQKSGISDDRK